MRVTVLGTAQDGGVPHFGCRCETCQIAREDPAARRYVTSLLLETTADRTYLIDATPDLRFQVTGPVDGIIVSHAHYGHLTGLLQCGREVANTHELPVYCPPSVATLVSENHPYRSLVTNDNVDLRELSPPDSVEFTDSTVRPLSVPHRQDLGTETLAFEIAADRTLLYVSDVDYWTDDVLESIRTADVALVDGTFWSDAELDDVDDVPHPRVKDTLDRLVECDTDVYLTHLNHTNPLLDPASPERQRSERAGFSLAERGQRIEL